MRMSFLNITGCHSTYSEVDAKTTRITVVSSEWIMRSAKNVAELWKLKMSEQEVLIFILSSQLAKQVYIFQIF